MKFVNSFGDFSECLYVTPPLQHAQIILPWTPPRTLIERQKGEGLWLGRTWRWRGGSYSTDKIVFNYNQDKWV